MEKSTIPARYLPKIVNSICALVSVLKEEEEGKNLKINDLNIIY